MSGLVSRISDFGVYTRDKFLLVLLTGQQVVVEETHPCVKRFSFPVEINSNPTGVRISYPTNTWKRLSNSGDKHMGIVIETYYLTTVFVYVDVTYMGNPTPQGQLIPVRLQGSEYFAVFPKNVAIERFFICVVTLSNNATVQVEVKRFDNRTHNDVYVASLTFIEAFVVSEIFDMSGSRILSNRAVAVSCMFILQGNVDIIQSLPAKVLGKQFALVPFHVKTERKVRIVTVAGSTYISQVNITPIPDCLPRGYVLDINKKSDGRSDITTFRANRPLLVLETVVIFNQMILLSPVEQYNTYIKDNTYTTNPHFASCIFINFSPIELNFTLSVTDVVPSREASAPFSTYTTYYDTDKISISGAIMNETVYASGVINITSSEEFSGSCIITGETFLPFLLRRYHPLGVIYQDCRLLKHEAGCSNCSATYTDDCQGRDDTQTDDCEEENDCEGRYDTHHGCAIELADEDNGHHVGLLIPTTFSMPSCSSTIIVETIPSPTGDSVADTKFFTNFTLCCFSFQHSNSS
ncbi:hypothetical protein ScPMuIL_017035 [Solemya velum]